LNIEMSAFESLNSTCSATKAYSKGRAGQTLLGLKSSRTRRC
jgi:hypothetical protein